MIVINENNEIAGKIAIQIRSPKDISRFQSGSKRSQGPRIVETFVLKLKNLTYILGPNWFYFYLIDTIIPVKYDLLRAFKCPAIALSCRRGRLQDIVKYFGCQVRTPDRHSHGILRQPASPCNMKIAGLITLSARFSAHGAPGTR